MPLEGTMSSALREALECSICFERFRSDLGSPQRPVVLPCRHVVCNLCATSQLAPCASVPGHVLCPSCRHSFPSNAPLPTSREILELLSSLEAPRDGEPQPHLATSRSNSLAGCTDGVSTACAIHANRPLELYCRGPSCGVMLCSLCAKTRHFDDTRHTLVHIEEDEFGEIVHSTARGMLSRVTQALFAQEQCIGELEARKKHVRGYVAESQARMRSLFGALKTLMDEREAHVVAAVRRAGEIHESHLTEQQSRHESATQDLRGLRMDVLNALQGSSCREDGVRLLTRAPLAVLSSTADGGEAGGGGDSGGGGGGCGGGGGGSIGAISMVDGLYMPEVSRGQVISGVCERLSSGLCVEAAGEVDHELSQILTQHTHKGHLDSADVNVDPCALGRSCGDDVGDGGGYVGAAGCVAPGGTDVDGKGYGTLGGGGGGGGGGAPVGPVSHYVGEMERVLGEVTRLLNNTLPPPLLITTPPPPHIAPSAPSPSADTDSLTTPNSCIYTFADAYVPTAMGSHTGFSNPSVTDTYRSVPASARPASAPPLYISSSTPLSLSTSSSVITAMMLRARRPSSSTSLPLSSLLSSSAVALSNVDPSKCVLTGAQGGWVEPGAEVLFRLFIMDVQGRPSLSTEAATVTVEGQGIDNVNVHDKQDGTYEIRGRVMSGMDQASLRVCVGGREISDSPTVVNIASPDIIYSRMLRVTAHTDTRARTHAPEHAATSSSASSTSSLTISSDGRVLVKASDDGVWASVLCRPSTLTDTTTHTAHTCVYWKLRVRSSLFGNLCVGLCASGGLTPMLMDSRAFYGFHGVNEGRAYAGGAAMSSGSGLPLRQGDEVVFKFEITGAAIQPSVGAAATTRASKVTSPPPPPPLPPTTDNSGSSGGGTSSSKRTPKPSNAKQQQAGQDAGRAKQQPAGQEHVGAHGGSVGSVGHRKGRLSMRVKGEVRVIERIPIQPGEEYCPAIALYYTDESVELLDIKQSEIF